VTAGFDRGTVARMQETTVWVLAKSSDATLAVLDPPPSGVRFVVGEALEAFRGAPAPDAIFVCSMGRRLVEPVLALAPGVRWIHSRSAGVEHLMFEAVTQSAVPLTNARGVFSASLGEFVMAAVLYFAKDFARMRRSQAASTWDPFDVDWAQGRTMGVVGYGDIGRAAAERARAFGMKVLALRRNLEAARQDPLVDEAIPLERKAELMARSDYVVVAAPLTSETRGLVGAAEIAAMKPTGVLINVGRGPIVDEDALLFALQEGRIRGAALDVFTTEPLPSEHAFYGLDNVLLSPHCADNTPGWLEAAMLFFLENLVRFRAGQPLLNLVDKDRGY
jgi:phosphoglycerate dehydrogenase-like enzyme